MHFFEHNFTKHHLLRAPHKWFLAFLVSPIHFLEMHYKKRYHLRFAHARKLFIFDMFLLASAMILVASSIAWFLYQPTIADQIELTIAENGELQKNFTDAPRVKSGEMVVYEIFFKNNSQSDLSNARLKIRLPAGFSQTETSSQYPYDESLKLYKIPAFDKGDRGSIKIKGLLFATPNREEYILAELSYKQKGRDVEEVKTSALVSILRGSVLTGALNMPERIINFHAQKAELAVQNAGPRSISDISVSLLLNQKSKMIFLSATKGKNINDSWQIDNLDPGENAAMIFSITPSLENNEAVYSLSLTPQIKFNNESIPQENIAKTLKVAHPAIKIGNSWQNNQTSVQHGDTVTLYSTLANSGDSALKDISLIIPAPANIIDIKKLMALNNGIYSKGVALNGKNIGSTFKITSAQRADLKELQPGHSAIIPIQIPIQTALNSGTDISLVLEPRAEAFVLDIPESKMAYKSAAPEVKIGTQLLLTAEARYYTEDGDQLGRGPLPPVAGKETKYGVIINIANTTSKAEKISLSGILPSYVRWTGKTSVGRGNDIKYNSGNNSIQWSLDSLPAHDSVLLFFEAGLTPSESQRGTTPILLQNIKITGFDPFIGKNLNDSALAVTSALVNDNRAKAKGIAVE